MAIDPKALLASKEILKRIEQVSRRQFPNENDADELYVFLLDELSKDDFRRLRSFQGKSKFTTFFFSVVNALAIDFVRGRYGRRRFPKAVSAHGKLAEYVYRLICWQRYSLQDAYEMSVVSKRFHEDFGAFIAHVDPVRRAPCPENPFFASLDDPEGAVQELADPAENPLESLLERLDHERRHEAARVIGELTASLPASDRLLVRLRYESDTPVRELARTFGLTKAEIKKKLKSLLTRYRASLLEIGIREF